MNQVRQIYIILSVNGIKNNSQLLIRSNNGLHKIHIDFYQTKRRWLQNKFL